MFRGLGLVPAEALQGGLDHLALELVGAFDERPVLRRLGQFRLVTDDDDAADIWDASFRAMGRRVVRGDAALVEAARYAAEAGGGNGF